jgi:O-antigen/teichoic acid export membrane protein
MKESTTNNTFSLKEQAGYLFFAKLLSFITRFAIPLVLVRIFSQEDFGIYRQLLLAGSFFIPILKLGAQQSLFFMYTPENARRLFAQTVFFFVSITIIFAPLYFLLREPLVLLFKNDNFSQYIVLCYLYTFFTISASVLETILILEKNSNKVFLYVFFSDTFRATLILVSAFLFYNVEYVFGAQVLFQGLTFLILFIYLQIKYKIFNIKKWDKQLIKSQFNYAYPLGLSESLRTVATRINVVFLNLFLTSTEYAEYTVARFRIPMLTEFYRTVGRVTRPKIAEYYREGNIRKATTLWHSQITKFSYVTIPMVVFFFVMANPIITFLYTEKYESSVDIFRILLLLLLLQTTSWGTIPKGFNETKFVLLSNTISMMSGVVSAWFFIKYWGLAGVALSLVLTLWIDVFMQLIKSKYILKLKFTTWLPWKNIVIAYLISLVLAIPLLFILQVDIVKPLKIIFGIIVFFTPLSLFFYKNDVLDINKEIKKIKNRYF